MAPACRRVTTHTSYWFSSRRSFRLCRVRISLTRLHTGPSPPALLSVCLCAYLGRLCTQRVCWLPTNLPQYVWVMRIQVHVRKNAGGRGRGRKKRDGENERKMICTLPIIGLFLHGPWRSDHDRGRHFGTGQRHWKYRYQVEGMRVSFGKLD